MVVGTLGRRLSPFTAMILGCAGSVLLFLAGTTLHLPQLALGCCVAVGFTGSCLWPTMLAVAADRQPDGGASMFGILASAGNAGGIVMPWLVGAVADGCGLRWGLAISAIAPALMLPLVLLLARRPQGSAVLAPEQA
jgi:MFS family permease